MTKANNISPYLVDAPTIFIESRSKPLCNVPKLTKGNQPSDGGNLILSEEERKELDDAPRNDWQAFLKSISNPFRNESERLQKCYESYVYDIQLYNRLILLTDIILYLKGDNGAIVRNHKAMVEYCKQYIDDSFREKMSYLMCNKTIDITNILEYNKRLEQTLKDVNIKGIQIECKIEDVKYLNNQ